ncbi:PKD domain-containing protein, partial [Pontibacter cellulosilyticus]
MVFVAAFFVMSNYAVAQNATTDLTNCYGSCTSNDFTITEVFLTTDAAGTDRVEADDCLEGGTIPVYLNFTFRNNTNSDRTGIFLSANVNGTPYKICFPGLLPKKQSTTYTYSTSIDWVCGTNLVLENTFVGWGSAGEQVCSNSCSQATPSKCRMLGDVIVNTPLIPDFSYVPECVTGGQFERVCFTNETTGGYQNYSYVWNFGDGTTSTLENPCHTYTSEGTFTVSLTVTDIRYELDADGNETTTEISRTVRTETKQVEVKSCCQFSVTCPSTNTDLGTFSCSNFSSIPALPTTVAAAKAAPYNIVIGDNPCEVIKVSSSDSETPSTCSSEDQNITRTVTIWDDLNENDIKDAGEPSQACTFTYTVVADKTPPVISVTGHTATLGCNPTASEITAAFGTATASDGCSGTASVT